MSPASQSEPARLIIAAVGLLLRSASWTDEPRHDTAAGCDDR